MTQSVDRALDVIGRLAQGPQRLSDLARALDVHRSTVLRLLQSLEDRRFARHHDDGSWGIGFGLVAAGQRALDNIDLRRVAHRHLVQLSVKLGHTIHLAQLQGNEVIYVDKVEGIGAVKMQSRIGAPAMMHTAGVAKVILAFAEPSVRSVLLTSLTYQRYTSATITSPTAMQSQLLQIAARGWAVDDGEFEDYINCVAAPIRDQSGAVVASVSVTALKALAPLQVLEGNVEHIVGAAAAISADMGYIQE